MIEAPKRTRRGRPPGQQHDATVHVRLPRPALALLRRLAAREGLRVAHVIRAALVAKLAAVARQCGDVIRDERRAARTKLQALEMHRLCMMATLYLSPTGLKIAQAEAAGLGADPPDDTL